MKSEWETYKLSNLCDIGSSKRIFQHEYVNNGIPFLRSKEVIDKALGSFEPKDLLFISHEKFNEIKSKYNIPKAGELLLSSVGNRSGIPYVIKEADGDFYFKDGNLTWFKNFKSLDSNFLFYWINSSVGQNTLNGIMIGSAQKALTISGLQNLTLTIPPLPIQKKIAHVLSTLDDKIELNRKMNQTLESMASAIFKSWFVDFDPVHAKANCTDEAEFENIAKELGISKEILDLFPSEFQTSELGMIPKGWKWKSFGELLTNTIGGDWGQDEADEKHTEKVRIIRGTDIPDIKNSTIKNVPIRFVESKKLATRKLFDGDIVIEISGGTKNQPTGRSLYVINEMLNVLDGEVEPASFCRLFRPINKEIGLMLAQHLAYIYGIGLTWNYQNQSTGISNFQTTTFLEKEFVVVPNDEIQKRFFSLVRPLIEKSFSAENITLQKTRDTLLPKLLSGEIDVSELEIL
jgi:type I restriction enzyme S subunit